MQQLADNAKQTSGYQLTLCDSKGQHRFYSSTIVRLEAADNYTVLYFNTRQKPFVISKVLKTYEDMLLPYGFIRIHRSHLVNSSFIERISGCEVVMKDQAVVRICKRKKREVVKRIGSYQASMLPHTG